MHQQRNAKSTHPPGSAARQQEKDLKQPSFILQRNGECPVHSLMEGSLMLENLTHGAVFNNLEALVATADPGVSCWEGKIHEGGKWYHILEGTLEVVADDGTHVLDEGDSIYLESCVPHIWRNPGATTAKALVLSSPPSATFDKTGAFA